MITTEMLDALGANTAEGLARCYGNEALYLRLVKMIPDEKNFDILQKALTEDDYSTAFEAAHALKGVLGNLSLTPMFETASQLTELLRSRTKTDCSSLVKELLSQKAELARICRE